MTATLLTTAHPVLAQGAVVARVASEIGESLFRRSATTGAAKTAAELAQFGGTKAVRELLEQAEKEGGELLVAQVARQTEKHGLLALNAMKGSPGAVVKALDNVPAELVENGLRAIVHEPVAMQALAREFGSEAIEVAARHPGLAGKISQSLGRDGLVLARTLTTREATMLARHADDLAKLAPVERAGFLTFIKESPAKALEWMGRNPKLLVAGSATVAIIAARKEIFGEGSTSGLLERAGAALYQTFQKPVNTVIGALTAIVMAWAGIKIWNMTRTAKR